jgi:protoporphyrin/coproporphyrin ferrochelatase
MAPLRPRALGSAGVDGYQALLLVSFGGPERAEDVKPFLRRVTAGRDVPESRLDKVAEHYYQAGGASPLPAACRALLEALRSELAGTSLDIYWGNRNWHPLLEDTLAQMRDDGIERALAFVTSAYGGYSSCRQYLDDIAAAQAKVGPGAPRVEKLRLYYNHPGWVEPWASNLSVALEACNAVTVGAPGAGEDTTGGTSSAEARPSGAGAVEVLFSAHSIPLALARNSPYVEHVTEAARLAAEGARVKSWQLVWQSRSGSPSSPWLGPDVSDVIRSSSARTFVVVPIGFACDNMEVVYDLDIEAAATAREKGAGYVRAATVSTSPAFVAMVRELVQERVAPFGPRRTVGVFGPWPDNCPDGHCPASAPMASRMPTG